ncbi:MAG TPA: hypothetical protein VHE81_17625 [Lacipirellulaceae bacterium]|nr:hypothetical protein [Lacipirellulaceae bacterium]HWB49057.1 hypothetical protein [Stellaceae bacterium]
MTVVRNIGPVLLTVGLLLAGCASPTAYTPDGNQGVINPLRVPLEPVLLIGTFSCTAYTEGGLPAITWRQIPFRQEGDRLTGLYTFKDRFGYQDSVVFNGAIRGGSARVTVTAVRSDGSSNFTAEMTGRLASMTGQMMLGTSQQAVRLCSLALKAAR